MVIGPGLALPAGSRRSLGRDDSLGRASISKAQPSAFTDGFTLG